MTADAVWFGVGALVCVAVATALGAVASGTQACGTCGSRSRPCCGSRVAEEESEEEVSGNHITSTTANSTLPNFTTDIPRTSNARRGQYLEKEEGDNDSRGTNGPNWNEKRPASRRTRTTQKKVYT